MIVLPVGVLLGLFRIQKRLRSGAMGCVTSRDVQAPGPVQPVPVSASIPSKQGLSKQQHEVPLKSKQQLVAAPYVPALQATSSVDFQIPTQGKFSKDLLAFQAYQNQSSQWMEVPDSHSPAIWAKWSRTLDRALHMLQSRRKLTSTKAPASQLVFMDFLACGSTALKTVTRFVDRPPARYNNRLETGTCTARKMHWQKCQPCWPKFQSTKLQAHACSWIQQVLSFDLA